MRRRLVALAALVAGACSLSPYGDLVDVGSRQPSARECGSCHVAVYEEFARSRHAEAWTRPAFVEATAGRSVVRCLGCHAPKSVYEPGPPKLRAARREEGVTCVSCHFDGEALTGPAPRSSLLDPHPVVVENPLYRDAALCGRCHEGTYREWLEAPGSDEGKKTCQECHMQPVRRTLTQPTGWLSGLLVGFEKEFDGRRHTFDVSAVAELEDAFLFTARRQAAGVVVALESRIPHRVPTGDFGFRRVRVTFTFRDASGRTVARREASLFKELGDDIAPGGHATWRFGPFPSASRLEIVLSSERRDGPPTPLFSVEVPIEKN